jgi:hypothetical protein
LIGTKIPDRIARTALHNGSSAVDALLERLSSGQIVAVISVLVGGVVALAMIVAITKYQFALLADDTALKRERHQAKVALREKLIERGHTSDTDLGALLNLDVSGSEDAEDGEEEDEEEDDEGEAEQTDLDGEVAKRLGMLSASPEEIEATMRLVVACDDSRKEAILGVIDELIGEDASHESILAAVRPLCTVTASKDHTEITNV